MDSKNQNTTIYNDYPAISDKLIECLQNTFSDRLPKKELSAFEYGKLVGQQEVIDKLKFEKDKNENN